MVPQFKRNGSTELCSLFAFIHVARSVRLLLVQLQNSCVTLSPCRQASAHPIVVASETTNTIKYIPYIKCTLECRD